MNKKEAIFKLIEYRRRLERGTDFTIDAEPFDMAIDALSAERTGRWIICKDNRYELAYGGTAYEPVYKCSACGLMTESYLRLDEPIMPEDADFPKYCPNCGAKMEKEVEHEFI